MNIKELLQSSFNVNRYVLRSQEKPGTLVRKTPKLAKGKAAVKRHKRARQDARRREAQRAWNAQLPAGSFRA